LIQPRPQNGKQDRSGGLLRLRRRGCRRRALRAQPPLRRYHALGRHAGQVGDLAPEVLESSDVAAQTRQTLAKIDKALAEAGTSKRHILRTEIWLKDIARDFGAMNEVFYEWVGEFPDQKGVRACVEANMARPKLLVEIMVIAAVPPS